MSSESKWAIITGASSGIGRSVAREFSAGGFHVLLTGRNQDALAQVARECASEFRVQTETVCADLSDPKAADDLIAAIQNKHREYGVLVNNAGFGVHGKFSETNVANELDLLNVQLAAAIKLTKAVLPGMIARNNGRILNIGSVYCYAPVPFQSVYSACKAFLLSFSAAIRSELSGTGITVTVFCPGITQTEFRKRAGIGEKDKSYGMSAEDAARIAFRATMQGKAVVIPGLPNKIFVFVAKLMPTSTFTGIVRYINRLRGHTE
jgi:short-subunit dehydrogenase